MKASASPVNGAAAVCTTHPKPAARKAGTAQTGKPKVKAKPKPEVATYSYTDKAGQTLFQVVYNYQGKDFDQRRPDGKGWTWKMEGVKPVLYRLPEILLYDDAPIVIVDREADADALHEMVEMLVTTNPGGSLHGKWLPEYSDTIAGRDAFIVPGNHEAG
ncbi:MAG TPA: hypothetical protein VEL76_32475, partial [Gemmataceae bacterium]|nr:hypothetical protein [Gemmataceae bacterium]